MKKKKSCRDCRYALHPDWAEMLPFFLICTHPKTINSSSACGRIDVQRNLKGGDFCGPEGKWWEPLNPPSAKGDTR